MPYKILRKENMFLEEERLKPDTEITFSLNMLKKDQNLLSLEIFPSTL